VDSVVVRGDFAELNDCFVDDGILVRSSDEQVVDDTITTLSHTVRLRRVSGEWKVEFVEVLRLPDDQTCTEVPS
jgi:hypothetical protein